MRIQGLYNSHLINIRHDDIARVLNLALGSQMRMARFGEHLEEGVIRILRAIAGGLAPVRNGGELEILQAGFDRVAHHLAQEVRSHTGHPAKRSGGDSGS